MTEGMCIIHMPRFLKKVSSRASYSRFSQNSPKMSKDEIFVCHIDCPGKLLPLRLVVNLLNLDVPFSAPGDRDSWIEVVQFGRPECYLFVFLLC